MKIQSEEGRGTAGVAGGAVVAGDDDGIEVRAVDVAGTYPVGTIAQTRKRKRPMNTPMLVQVIQENESCFHCVHDWNSGTTGWRDDRGSIRTIHFRIPEPEYERC